MCPGVSRSSGLCGFLDVVDGSGGVDVLKVFSRTTRAGAGRWLAELCWVGWVLYGLAMTETELISEIGRRLAAAAPAGSRVVLFGSRARGEAHSRSDYDMLVIEPAVENVAVESTRLRGELDDLRSPIDVVVVAEDVARRRSVVRGTVVDRALREGRVLAHT
jgi:predicted nucleotidyltransferase